jgi:hypothetical protein
LTYKYVNKKMVKYVHEILHMYGVKARTHKSVKKSEADCMREIVYISPWQIEEDFIGSAIHELQHILNKRNGKYPAYHGLKGTKAEYRATILHGVQAEKYTDREARKLFKEHFPGFKYHAGYLHPSGPWWFGLFQRNKAKREYAKYFKRF